jgi:hypothetical protein
MACAAPRAKADVVGAAKLQARAAEMQRRSPHKQPTNISQLLGRGGPRDRL